MNPDQETSLLELMHFLQTAGYRFVTPTPVTHGRVLAHKESLGTSLQDAFGWNMPFNTTLLPLPLTRKWLETGILTATENSLVSTVRVSSLDDRLFLHSSYPTLHENAVFFGPDTYRFVRFVLANLGETPLQPGCHIVDIGCGNGAGGLTVASRHQDSNMTLADINPAALSHARLNALHNMLKADLRLSDLFSGVDGKFDVIISNPPYLNDTLGRTYRHGGGKFGGDLSLRIIEEGLERLNPNGKLFLYTGSAIENGVDLLREQAINLLRGQADLDYQEIDVDIFGEELENPAYPPVDRIAAVGLVITLK